MSGGTRAVWRGCGTAGGAAAHRPPRPHRRRPRARPSHPPTPCDRTAGGWRRASSCHRLCPERRLEVDQAIEQLLVDARIDRADERQDAADMLDDHQQRAVERLSLRSLRRLKWKAPADEVRIERVDAADGLIERPDESLAELVGRMVIARMTRRVR